MLTSAVPPPISKRMLLWSSSLPCTYRSLIPHRMGSLPYRCELCIRSVSETDNMGFAASRKRLRRMHRILKCQMRAEGKTITMATIPTLLVHMSICPRAKYEMQGTDIAYVRRSEVSVISRVSFCAALAALGYTYNEAVASSIFDKIAGNLSSCLLTLAESLGRVSGTYHTDK